MLGKLFSIYPPALALFLSSAPSETLERRGKQFALQAMHEAYARVPAYRKYLANHQVEINEIKTIYDFKKVPLMDKASYLQQFPIQELCLDGTLRGKYLIDGSSGYGGKRSFWPRLPQEDMGYPMYMELAYRQFYDIDRKSTLMIITLGLGTWVGGEKISWATRQIAISGRNHLTVMTPGVNLEETLDIVKQFGDLYEQIVIVGYPPFVKRIVNCQYSRHREQF